MFVPVPLTVVVPSAFGVKNNCRITHVCDPDTDRAKLAIERGRSSNGGVDPLFVRDLRRVLDDRSIDVVTIATRGQYHARITHDCCARGVRGIYCEKPMANVLTDADQMVADCKASGTVLTMGHERRWMSQIVAVRDIWLQPGSTCICVMNPTFQPEVVALPVTGWMLLVMPFSVSSMILSHSKPSSRSTSSVCWPSSGEMPRGALGVP